MGQGAESCNGYEVDYDPYDFRESCGYEFWTMKNGASINIKDMTAQHLSNAIRLCNEQSRLETFSCESDKWDEWAETFRHELFIRGEDVVPATRKKPERPKWTGKVENLSPKKANPVVAKKGSTLKLKCWCGTVYNPRIADLKRGWGKCCCKSCAAIKRDFGRPDPVCADTGTKLSKLLEAL